MNEARNRKIQRTSLTKEDIMIRKHALNNTWKLSNIWALIRILAFVDKVHKHRIITPSISFETQTHVHESIYIKQSITLSNNT
jgi:hypothetical protein